MTDKFDALMAKEEELLKKGVSQTMKAYNEKSTVANLRDWEAAKDAYEKFKAKQQAPAEVVAFATKREVISYLIQQGWDVKPDSSKVNDDLKGLPRKQGVWSKKIVDDYAAMALRKADGINSGGDAEAKAREEARLTRERADKIAFENEIMRGKYLLRSEVDRQFAARAAFLKDGVGSRFIHGRAPRIVEMVGGEMGKVPDLVDMWLKEVEELFDHYSRPLEFEAVNIIATEDTE